MCSTLQKKSLCLYLKSLEDQRNALHPMLDTISKAIDECNFWITEKDSSKKPFGELIQQLEEINDSNLKTYSLLLGHFNLEVDAETHLDKLSKPTLETTDQLQNLEQKCLQLEDNFDTLNNSKKNVEIKQKSYKKKSKYHERRIIEIEEKIKALTERVEAQTESLTTHSDQTKQNTASLNELKKLITTDQRQIQETEENVQTLLRKSNDSETTMNAMSVEQLQFTSTLNNLNLKYGTLCQVLAKRYNVLDSVKDGLSKLYVSREDTFLKLNDRISALEERSNTSFVGFCVNVQTCEYNPKSGDTITEFSAVNFNIGGHFNTSTGEFTVPSDGVYCVGFTVYGNKDSDSAIELILRQENDESSSDDQSTCSGKEDDVNLNTQSEIDKNRQYYDMNFYSLNIRSYPQHFVAVETFFDGDKLFLKYNVKGESKDMPNFLSFTCYKIHDLD